MNGRGGFDSGDVFWWMVVVEMLVVGALALVS